MTQSRRILITDPIHPDAVTRLTEAGFDVTELPETERSQLLDTVAPYEAIICRTSTPITAEVFDRAPKLAVVAIASTGYDRIDIEEAKRRKVAVLGLPSFDPSIDPEHDGNFVSTAEHAILLILAALGDFYHAYQSMKDGRWEKKHLVGNELAGKTVGFFGFGRIATLVARRLKPFRVRLIAYDPYASSEKAVTEGVELVSFETFCREVDIISIHAPKTSETEGKLDQAAFDQMKDGVFIINTARSAIVDQSALVQALESGKVRRAAFDVFHDEPDGVHTGLSREIIQMQNVIATPHIGGSTHEAWRRISMRSAENIIAYFNGDVRNRINV